jgi:hypothetical protein
MSVLQNVRIWRLPEWSWERNECLVTFQPGEAPRRAPLPPLASPCVLYASVRLAGEDVEDWLDEPAAWAPVELMGELPEKPLAAARTTLVLGAAATREAVLHAARQRDVQLIASMGHHQGWFDGEGLQPHERDLLFANWPCFGRHRRRCLRAPHAVVLPRHTDSLAVQSSDFRRSSAPELCRLAAALPAWRAARSALLSGTPLPQERLALAFGDDAAAVVYAEGGPQGPVPRAPLPTSPPTPGPHTVVVVGSSVNVCFSKPPGAAPGTTHWFASCVATAARHPRVRHIVETPVLPRVNAYAVHEVEGPVYVVSAEGDAAVCSDGRTVTRAGLFYVAHPTVAEGGCTLFQPGSLASVGLYCDRGDGLSWTHALARQVMALLAPGGVVFTNAKSTAFIHR